MNWKNIWSTKDTKVSKSSTWKWSKLLETDHKSWTKVMQSPGGMLGKRLEPLKD